MQWFSCGRPISLLLGAAGVKNPVQGIPQLVYQKDDEDQGQARKQGGPPHACGQIAHALRQDDADGRLLRGQAKAQEGRRGLVEDGMGEQKDQAYKKLRRQMGQQWWVRIQRFDFPSLRDTAT